MLLLTPFSPNDSTTLKFVDPGSPSTMCQEHITDLLSNLGKRVLFPSSSPLHNSPLLGLGMEVGAERGRDVLKHAIQNITGLFKYKMLLATLSLETFKAI